MNKKKGSYQVNSLKSRDQGTSNLGITSKVFTSVGDVSLHRKHYILTDILVNKPIRYQETCLQSGEILEILVAEDDSDVTTHGLVVKVYSSGEVVFLPSHIVGNFIDCSSKLIGGGCNKSMEEIREYTVGNRLNINFKNADHDSYIGDNKYRIDGDINRNTQGEKPDFTTKNDLQIIDEGLIMHPKYKSGGLRNISLNDNIDEGNLVSEGKNIDNVEPYITMSPYDSNRSTEYSQDEEYVNIRPVSCLLDYKSRNTDENLGDSPYIKINKTPMSNNKEWRKIYSVKTKNEGAKLLEKRSQSQRGINSLTNNNDAFHSSSNISKYGVIEVINLFSNLSLDHCKDALIMLGIDGKTLINLTENDIHEKIGVSKFEARLAYFYIKGWRPLTESVTNWKEKKEKEDFSTMDLISYLGYFGYANLSRYIYDYNVDGRLFMKLLEDDLLMGIVFDDGSKLEKYELDDLVIRFTCKRERTHRISRQHPR